MDPDPTARTHATRVLVVDDQRLVRAALRVALEEDDDLLVVGEAASADEGLRLCASLVPDVVIVDLAGPGLGEVELTRRLAVRHPHVQVMVVTAEVDGDRVGRALDSGAVGYLLKDTEPQALRDGVRAVARGESPLDPRAVRAMLRARPGVRGEDLTVREREVLSLVARGLANKQIARQLCITDGTVKAHVGSIFARIGVTDRTSAAVWAERNLAVAALPPRVSARDEWGSRDEWADLPARVPATRDTPARSTATRGRVWPAPGVGRLQPATA